MTQWYTEENCLQIRVWWELHLLSWIALFTFSSIFRKHSYKHCNYFFGTDWKGSWKLLSKYWNILQKQLLATSNDERGSDKKRMKKQLPSFKVLKPENKMKLNYQSQHMNISPEDVVQSLKCMWGGDREFARKRRWKHRKFPSSADMSLLIIRQIGWGKSGGVASCVFFAVVRG